MRRIGVLAAAMIGLGGLAHAAEPAIKDQGDRYSGAPQATRSAVLGTHGMAATSQPLATQIALDVLKGADRQRHRRRPVRDRLGSED